MEKVKVDKELLVYIQQYLKRRPWEEVNDLIVAIAQSISNSTNQNKESEVTSIPNSQPNNPEGETPAKKTSLEDVGKTSENSDNSKV